MWVIKYKPLQLYLKIRDKPDPTYTSRRSSLVASPRDAKRFKEKPSIEELKFILAGLTDPDNDVIFNFKPHRIKDYELDDIELVKYERSKLR